MSGSVSWVSNLVTSLSGESRHDFPTGVSPEAIAKVETQLGYPIPEPLRQWVRLTDGASLFGGEIDFCALGDLVELQHRMKTGWFDKEDCHWFAEGKWEAGADFFCIKIPEGTVWAFSADPAFFEERGDFVSWIEALTKRNT